VMSATSDNSLRMRTLNPKIRGPPMMNTTRTIASELRSGVSLSKTSPYRSQRL
jgi:hypothetical protein